MRYSIALKCPETGEYLTIEGAPGFLPECPSCDKRGFYTDIRDSDHYKEYIGAWVDHEFTPKKEVTD